MDALFYYMCGHVMSRIILMEVDMINRQRTIEVYGYDIDPSVRRRSKEQFNQTNKVVKKKLIVIDNCPQCNEERHITYRASIKNRVCYKCHHNKDHVIEAKKNQKRNITEETRQKMIQNHWSKQGLPPVNKGQTMDHEFVQKVSKAIKKWNSSSTIEERKARGHKAAATKAGLSAEDYTQVTDVHARLRGSIEYREWEQAVFKRDGFRCIISSCKHSRYSNITAHHLDGFHWCVDKRHDVDNGVTLCKYHHRAFHARYLCRNNTKSQFEEWKSNVEMKTYIKPKLYMVAGCSGSGKSWVCKQLTDLCDYVSYDYNRKKLHLDLLLQPSVKPKLYDPPIKISTFFKRHSDKFDIHAVFILEEDTVIKHRIIQRGGEWTDHISKRNAAMRKRFEKYGEFAGTSQEVLDYLRIQVANEKLK